jgi:hypothetical protein
MRISVLVRKTPSVETPVFSPSNGSDVSPSTDITISSETPGASIYYTTNGSTPTTESTLYTGAFNLTESEMNVKAIAVKSGFNNSDVAEVTYNYVNDPPTVPFTDTFTSLDNWTDISPNSEIVTLTPSESNGLTISLSEAGYAQLALSWPISGAYNARVAFDETGLPTTSSAYELRIRTFNLTGNGITDAYIDTNNYVDVRRFPSGNRYWQAWGYKNGGFFSTGTVESNNTQVQNILWRSITNSSVEYRYGWTLTSTAGLGAQTSWPVAYQGLRIRFSANAARSIRIIDFKVQQHGAESLPVFIT